MQNRPEKGSTGRPVCAAVSFAFLRSTDGGITWNELATPAGDPNVSVSYVGLQQGLAITYGGGWGTPSWRTADGVHLP
jgi:hypothetical protein